MTRVDDATVCEVKARRAVRGDIFQCTAEIKLDKILENFLDALRRARGVNILALRVAAHEDERDIEIDHRNAEGAAAARFGNDFGSHADRVFHAVVEIPIEVCHLPRAGKTAFVARDGVIFRVRHRAERLGEAIPALPQRLTVLCNGKIHTVACGVIKAVTLHKIKAAAAGVEPFRLRAVDCAQMGKDPAAPPLHPDALIRGIDFTGSVEAGIDTAEFRIHAVFQPKIYAAIQFRAYPSMRLGKLLFSHFVHVHAPLATIQKQVCDLCFYIFLDSLFNHLLRTDDGVHVGCDKIRQRRAHSTDVHTFTAQNLFHDGVEIAMAAAHLINDAAAFVLNFACQLHAPGVIAFVDFEIELRHDGVGAADAAGRADGKTRDQLLVRTVEHDELALGRIKPHLDILRRHRRVFNADDAQIFSHFLQKLRAERDTRKLWDVIDDKIRVWRSRRDRIPIVRDGIRRQMEIDRRDGGDCVNAEAFGVPRQLAAVGGVVTGDVRDDDELAANSVHNGFEDGLAFFYTLVDAFTRGTTNIKTCYAFGKQVLSQRLCSRS